jgi:peroxiredoxin
MSVCLLALPFGGIAQQPEWKKVKISGQFVNLEEKFNRVYVFYTEDGEKHLDSATVVDGKYTMELSILEPMLVTMLGKEAVPGGGRGVMMGQGNRMDVYLEPGNLKITNTGKFVNYTVEGSKSHSEYVKINKQAKEYQEKLQELVKQQRAADVTPEQKQELQERINKTRTELTEGLYKKYLDENPQSPILFYVLQKYAGTSKEGQYKIMEMYRNLPAEQRDSKAGIAFAKRLQGQMDISIGSMAPDFTLPTPDGELVSLSSKRGKYVLLDFWASWCGPCRKENPNVVIAYNKFKDKGFTVLGVSLDNAGGKEKWIEAIKKDNLGAWANVSDLKYWSSEPALKYGVTGIPQNFLIDPSGKIIAKSLRGEDLLKKLEELL